MPLQCASTSDSCEWSTTTHSAHVPIVKSATEDACIVDRTVAYLEDTVQNPPCTTWRVDIVQTKAEIVGSDDPSFMTEYDLPLAMSGRFLKSPTRADLHNDSVRRQPTDVAESTESEDSTEKDAREMLLEMSSIADECSMPDSPRQKVDLDLAMAPVLQQSLNGDADELTWDASYETEAHILVDFATLKNDRDGIEFGVSSWRSESSDTGADSSSAAGVGIACPLPEAEVASELAQPKLRHQSNPPDMATSCSQAQFSVSERNSVSISIALPFDSRDPTPLKDVIDERRDALAFPIPLRVGGLSNASSHTHDLLDPCEEGKDAPESDETMSPMNGRTPHSPIEKFDEEDSSNKTVATISPVSPESPASIPFDSRDPTPLKDVIDERRDALAFPIPLRVGGLSNASSHTHDLLDPCEEGKDAPESDETMSPMNGRTPHSPIEKFDEEDSSNKTVATISPVSPGSPASIPFDSRDPTLLKDVIDEHRDALPFSIPLRVGGLSNAYSHTHDLLDPCEEGKDAPESDETMSPMNGRTPHSPIEKFDEEDSSNKTVATISPASPGSPASIAVRTTNVSESEIGRSFPSAVDKPTEEPIKPSAVADSTLAVDQSQNLTANQTDVSLEQSVDTESEDAWTIASDLADSFIGEDDGSVTSQRSTKILLDAAAIGNTLANDTVDAKDVDAVDPLRETETDSVVRAENPNDLSVNDAAVYPGRTESSTTRASSDEALVPSTPATHDAHFGTVEKKEQDDMDEAWDEFLQSASSMVKQKAKVFGMTDPNKVLASF
ncbi:hypothetical protein CYMTET_55208 [Cymbomonas tetramitiformis]|uniref:Uncharacterized protein n=1 Tax=Cymbomonas tetramitiformis TaxID=36881 RepID=A0AAE0BDM8_9CHLO|nr:hypothetical protein CYMTET_55208 [Cymbomonas tetramitiformis]